MVSQRAVWSASSRSRWRCAAARSRSPRCRSRWPTARPSRASASARSRPTSSSAATGRRPSSSSPRASWTEIEDGKIDGGRPGHRRRAEPGAALPLAIWVEVAGRKMQADFEPILERQIHHLVNGARGHLAHGPARHHLDPRSARRPRPRASRIRHLGEILHAKFLNDYPAIVDKVQVTLFTDARRGRARASAARARSTDARNQRLESLTDESVDTFYSCLLCQSFAPNHVCVITPERLGLCGAYNWLDGKAAYEIDPTGPNQPLPKGECLDPVRGQWEGINEYVYANSKQTIECFNAYSMLDHPMTSCGCFEAIVACCPSATASWSSTASSPATRPSGMTLLDAGQHAPAAGSRRRASWACGKVYRHQPQVHLGRGRPPAHRLDAAGTEGGPARGPRPDRRAAGHRRTSST